MRIIDMDGIIFDLDGTLWDSTEAVATAWNIALEQKTNLERHVTGKELRGLFGKPLEEIFTNLFPDMNREELMKMAKVLYEYQHQYLESHPCGLYDNVEQVMRELAKKYPLFIVSNCQAGYIEVFLKATGLGDVITDHTCPGDTGEFKAENIRSIMKKNQLEHVVYVGDTGGDKKACDKAQVPMIFAEYGFGNVREPWMTIQKFEELLNIDYEKLI